MASVKDRIAAEMEALAQEGSQLVDGMVKKDQAVFLTRYHPWYTRALAVVRHLMPDREADFRRLYDRDSRRKTFDFETYTLEDYVQGLGPGRSWDGVVKFDMHEAALAKFWSQLEILRSAQSRLSDILANIRGVLQADLFDSELDAARHLLKNGFLRAGGAVAGVVLEHHLKEVADKHQVNLGRKKATIANLNDALRDAGVYDLADWRWVQRLGDIRNLSDHKKEREPRPEEIDDLIDGAEKAVKTLA